MRRRLQYLAMVGLMAFLWLAQASHSHAGEIPGLSFLGCNSANPEHEAHSCCGGMCKAPESRQGKLEDKKPAPTPQPEAPRWLALSLITLLLSESETRDGGDFATLPPELPKCWQFLSRSAGLVRAPSFIS